MDNEIKSLESVETCKFIIFPGSTCKLKMYLGSTSKFIMYPDSTCKFIMYPCSTCKQRGNGNKKSGSLCAAARSERFSRKHLFGVEKNVCRLPV